MPEKRILSGNLLKLRQISGRPPSGEGSARAGAARARRTGSVRARREPGGPRAAIAPESDSELICRARRRRPEHLSTARGRDSEYGVFFLTALSDSEDGRRGRRARPERPRQTSTRRTWARARRGRDARTGVDSDPASSPSAPPALHTGGGGGGGAAPKTTSPGPRAQRRRGTWSPWRLVPGRRASSETARGEPAGHLFLITSI